MKRPILLFCLLFFIPIISFLFFFNTGTVAFSTINVEGKFSIAVPSYLSKTDSIDASALLQYENKGEQLFLLVYEKRDSLALDDLFDKISNSLISKINHGALLKYYPAEINSHHALVGNIRGMVNNTGVYYRVAIIEAAYSYYEIIVGTSENNRSNYDRDITTIIQSFDPSR